MYNWGIVGTGSVAYHVGYAIQSFKKNKIVAVSSRTLENAKKYASTLNIEKFYPEVDQLLDDSSIHIIYIANINSLHFETIESCLMAGKHVLCEKPLVLTEKEGLEVQELAKQKNLFLMEAMWTRFLPSVQKIYEMVTQNELGEIKMIQGSFGAKLTKKRCFEKTLGGGSSWDLGIYLLSLTHLFLGKPISTNITHSFNQGDVDTSSSFILKYKNGTIANLTSSFDTNLENNFSVYGTKGILKLNAPFYRSSIIEWSENKEIANENIPPRNPFTKPSFLKNVSSTKQRIFHSLQLDTKKIVIPFTGNGYQYQIEEVLKCLENNQIESLHMPLKHSIAAINLIENTLK